MQNPASTILFSMNLIDSGFFMVTAKDFTAKVEENIWDQCPGKRGGGGWGGIWASLELTELSG